jgi:predicted HicB family RNase H-like nuclease
VKAKDAILHIRIESQLREKAAKKANRAKKTLTQYVCDLIAADTQRKSRVSQPVRNVNGTKDPAG